MPVVRDPGSGPARHGPGWVQQAWVTPQLLGVPVPMQAWRSAGTVWTTPGDRSIWAPAS